MTAQISRVIVILTNDISGMQTAPMLDKKDQCLGNPCQNEGLCIDGDYRYTCQCLPGFHGDKCQHSVFEEKPSADQTQGEPETWKAPL